MEYAGRDETIAAAVSAPEGVVLVIRWELGACAGTDVVLLARLLLLKYRRECALVRVLREGQVPGKDALDMAHASLRRCRKGERGSMVRLQCVYQLHILSRPLGSSPLAAMQRIQPGKQADRQARGSHATRTRSLSRGRVCMRVGGILHGWSAAWFSFRLSFQQGMQENRDREKVGRCATEHDRVGPSYLGGLEAMAPLVAGMARVH